MDIDIIDLGDPNYQELTAVQLAMVNTAQRKKNEITRKLNEEKREMLILAISNRTARSTAIKLRLSDLDIAAEEEIAAIREDLDYQLRYEAYISEGNEIGPYRYPENPNYNLNYSQRFLVVRAYYMHVTDNADARLQAFAMDSLARQYLGSYYNTLYDLLASYT